MSPDVLLDELVDIEIEGTAETIDDTPIDDGEVA